MRPPPPSLDRSVRLALTSFATRAFDPNWRGREREAISLFAFGYLLEHFNGREPLRDPAQIGIEVCVPGVKAENEKGRVNKDLVIWSDAAMSTFNEERRAVYSPLCIMEWTTFRTGRSRRRAWEYDIRWLESYTKEWPDCTGYAVALLVNPPAPTLRVARVQRGDKNRSWLVKTPGSST